MGAPFKASRGGMFQSRGLRRLPGERRAARVRSPKGRGLEPALVEGLQGKQLSEGAGDILLLHGIEKSFARSEGH